MKRRRLVGFDYYAVYGSTHRVIASLELHIDVCVNVVCFVCNSFRDSSTKGKYYLLLVRLPQTSETKQMPLHNTHYSWSRLQEKPDVHNFKTGKRNETANFRASDIIFNQPISAHHAWERPLALVVILLTCIMASGLEISSHSEEMHQSTSVDLVRGIRLTLIGKTYKSLNDHYCVVWDITSKLSFCSVSSSNCSINDDVRTFYFDCFCGLDPGSGSPNANEGYLVSVDTLPKLKEQHQEFRLVHVPGCRDFPNHENCQLTPKENWRPLFSSLEQLCNFSSISLTFDLPPLEYDVKKFSLYLYKKGRSRAVWRKSDQIVSQLDIYEKISFNTTYNVTTLICPESLELNSSYYLATRIRDQDLGKSYTLKRIKSTSVFLRSPPCSTNPCSTKEVCIEDCFNFTCVCATEAIRIKGECEVPWYPKDLKVTSNHSTHVIFFAESPPHNSRIGKFRIGLFTNGLVEHTHAQTTTDPDGTIYASFNNLQANKTYTPAVKIADECPRCQYKFYDSSKFSVHLEDTRPYLFIAYTASAVFSIILLACLTWYHRTHKISKGQ
ncbi:hypothetical protein HOLleu_05464 [Holothuria leucospilota]|uniref:Uncharacterized protein n=1 Tax=Holothuria leucospilota TaxID=206669 RepID=A0A9Q1CLN8_HOLLE|nr:hypothetical protein HOLleu_05464 [Holothuria leucospilota]